eukprot:CAMPEP_0179318676 /NCGR_PEP_ID=MMETSP0797-20121207/57036_1 /TAXON_ID=47934 /ORGANISM="Dinophysis acuminata, Strain DAEP01" /LENGTH=39 /DNA_ID= /DNA_START= /DNA_END= /DNA_ORIENTATION=
MTAYLQRHTLAVGAQVSGCMPNILEAICPGVSPHAFLRR